MPGFADAKVNYVVHPRYWVLVIYIDVENVVTQFPKGVGLKHARVRTTMKGQKPTASYRLNWLKIKSLGKLPIVLREFIEHNSNE